MGAGVSVSAASSRGAEYSECRDASSRGAASEVIARAAANRASSTSRAARASGDARRRHSAVLQKMIRSRDEARRRALRGDAPLQRRQSTEGGESSSLRRATEGGESPPGRAPPWPPRSITAAAAAPLATPCWRCTKCQSIQTATLRCEACGHTLQIFSRASLANQGAGEALSAAAAAAIGPPSQPDAPSLSGVGSDSCVLRWAPPWPDGGSPVSLFTLEVKCLSGGGAAPGSPSGAGGSRRSGANRTTSMRSLQVGLQTMHTIEGLEPNAVYSFRVRAENAAGFCSPPSPSIAARTLRPPPSAPPLSVLRSIGTVKEVWDEAAERVYYYESTTGRATWDPPIAFDASHAAFARKRFRLMTVLRKPPGGVIASPLQLSISRACLLADSIAWWRAQGSSSSGGVGSRSSGAGERRQRARTAYGGAEGHARLRIEFLGEEAIDSGGVANEWFFCLSKELFAADGAGALFEVSPGDERRLLPRRGATDDASLERFAFAGWLLAKALIRGRLVHAPLATPVFRLVCCCVDGDLRASVTLLDLAKIDGALAKSWEWLLANDLDPLSRAGLLPSLSVVRVVSGGVEAEVEVEVSEANKEALVAEALVSLIYASRWKQLKALRRGFVSIVPSLHALLAEHTFSGDEVSQLLNGRSAEDVGVETIRNSVVFAGGYSEHSTAIVLLFRALDRFSTVQLSRLLLFCTGSAHVPLDGWQPPLTIAMAEVAEGYEPLPRAHTCFNRLVLPNYVDYAKLLEKLLFAIESCEGFQLT